MKVQTNGVDNPTYTDILRGSSTDKIAWEYDMTNKLKSLAELGSFEMVDRPRDAKILHSAWAFKRKRFPDSTLRKNKARFCVRGDQQIEGLDVLNTYAPVVS